jgi:hypothetical protein
MPTMYFGLNPQIPQEANKLSQNKKRIPGIRMAGTIDLHFLYTGLIGKKLRTSGKMIVRKSTMA